VSTEQQIEWLRNRVANIAEQMRRDAERRKFVNPSHLNGYADELERALRGGEGADVRTVVVPVYEMTPAKESFNG
jgi:hypothetical protein